VEISITLCKKLNKSNKRMKEIKQQIIKRKNQHTQRALAKKLGCSEQYIGQILSGKRAMPKRFKSKIQKFINN